MPSTLPCVVAGLLFAILAGCAGSATKTDRWNVLFIVSDDLNNRLGCYGAAAARTPNIDAFAATAVRFDRAYCQFPLCNPSRVSFMTGRRPDTTRVYENRTGFRAALPEVLTLPQVFRKGGYYAARVGKIFHYAVPAQIGTDGADDKASWDLAINPRGRDKDDEEKIIQYTGAKGSLGAAISYLAADGADEEQTDGKTVTEAIRLMEENWDKPFFIAAGLFRPHVPCVAPKKYFDLHPREKMTLPDEPAGHLEAVPPIALAVKPAHYGLKKDQLHEFLQAYHASVSYVDSNVGRLLEALDRLGLRERTIVVFMSDHGWLLGEHGQWQKMSLFEESARVPLLIRAPGAGGNGKACPRTVELIDLLPTLADLCGLDPAGAEGKSLRALLDDPSAAWERPAYTQVTRGMPVATYDKPAPGQKAIMGRSVRNEKWRYTEWDEGRAGVELYDETNDPKEHKNVATDPKLAQVVAEMKKLLAAGGK